MFNTLGLICRLLLKICYLDLLPAYEIISGATQVYYGVHYFACEALVGLVLGSLAFIPLRTSNFIKKYETIVKFGTFPEITYED